MKNHVGLIKSLLTLTFSLSLIVGSTWAAGDKTKGEQLYQKCVQCHGKNGEGVVAQKGPRIAGQYDWYIVTQAKNIRDNVRSNPPMLPFVKGLSDKDIEDLAAYISQLKLK